MFRSIPIRLDEKLFLSQGEIAKDVQILRVGTFFHNGQEINVKQKDLKNMVQNFNEKVRGIDLMLDYSHESEKEAAAWFKRLYLSEDEKELWAEVDWTDDGADAVKKKKYRYISADFDFAYKDNETKKDYGPTLFGAGLTNRPVVKKMNPTIELSETQKYSKDDKMEKEQFEKEMAEMKKKLAEKDEEIKELKEKSKDKKLSEKEVELAERENKIKLAEEKAATDKKLADKKGEFDKMLSEGKVVEAQRKAFMEDNFAEFAKNASAVNLSEKGTGKEGSKESFNGETPAQDEVISLAEKKAKSENISLAEAQRQILSENPELNKKYEKEVSGQ